jgi:hypothetical protein
MRMKIINIIPIFMNLTRRIEFRIKERYDFLPVDRSAILQRLIPFRRSALQ